MLPLKTAVSMPPPPVSVSWPDPPWIVSAKTEPMTSSLPLSASIREMATSRVAPKSRKLLVAVPANMLLPPRPSIERLAERERGGKGKRVFSGGDLGGQRDMKKKKQKQQ